MHVILNHVQHKAIFNYYAIKYIYEAWLRQNYNGTEVQHIADNLCGQAARTLMQLLTKTTVHYVTDSTKRHHSDQLKKILNNREFIHVLGGNSILFVESNLLLL